MGAIPLRIINRTSARALLPPVKSCADWCLPDVAVSRTIGVCDAAHTSRRTSLLPNAYDPKRGRLCLLTPIVESSLLQFVRMASRNFSEPNGTQWHVWNTVPVSGAVINPGFEKGWLTLESEGGSLRRLAPVPGGWETLNEERLVELLRNSKVVPRHTGPMRRITPRDAEDPMDRA